MKQKILLGVVLLALASPAQAGPREVILEFLATQAQATNSTFSGFSAAAGEQLFLATFTTGKPETTSCTTCHTNSPANVGETRAGKSIDPMAVSLTPGRFTDQSKIDKWFRRNCNSVLGRECTAQEKGDFITFMSTQ
jgi:hypothetical protein